MLEAAAQFETQHGRRYLGQLCRHFAHKAEVTHAEDDGECRFSYGTAAIRAEPGRLLLRASARTGAELEQVKAVVESHLLRFAFREGRHELDWTAKSAS